MTDVLIFLIATLAVSLTLLVDRYFAWREWDARRRREREIARMVNRFRVNMRLMNLEIGLNMIPAAQALSRALTNVGVSLGKMRPPNGNA